MSKIYQFLKSKCGLTDAIDAKPNMKIMCSIHLYFIFSIFRYISYGESEDIFC